MVFIISFTFFTKAPFAAKIKLFSEISSFHMGKFDRSKNMVLL